jgi:hypothetical protein
MIELLSAVIGALIGSISSAIFSLYYGLWNQKRRRKLETTVTLYQEYQTHSMLSCRIKTSKLLRQSLIDFNLSYVELYHRLSTDDWLAISTSLHFRERLAVYHKVEYLDNKLAKALFSDSFSSDYDGFLKVLNRISIQKGHIDEFVLSTEELAEWLYNPQRKNSSLTNLLGGESLRNNQKKIDNVQLELRNWQDDNTDH